MSWIKGLCRKKISMTNYDIHNTLTLYGIQNFLMEFYSKNLIERYTTCLYEEKLFWYSRVMGKGNLPFWLISTQENKSNDMLHAYIIKHLILTCLGTTQWSPGWSILPKWANRGLVLVLMILGHFSLISFQENRYNGMLCYMPILQSIHSGYVGNGLLGGDCHKKISHHLWCGKKHFLLNKSQSVDLQSKSF